MAKRKHTDENQPVTLDSMEVQGKHMTGKDTIVTDMVVKGKTYTVEIPQYTSLQAARKDLTDAVLLKHLNAHLSLDARTRRRVEIESGGTEKKMEKFFEKMGKINPAVAEAARNAWMASTTENGEAVAAAEQGTL